MPGRGKEGRQGERKGTKEGHQSGSVCSKIGSKIELKEKAIYILYRLHLKLYLIFKDTLKEAIMTTISQLFPCVYNLTLVCYVCSYNK